MVARRVDSKLVISVQDDGVGFDRWDSLPGNGGIGLQNVRARITLLDPANTMRIESKPGVGTTVVIELPIEIHDKGGANGSESQRILSESD